MEAFPIEIIDQILDDMDGPIASTAFISPVWKKVVESRTFVNVTVSSRKLEIFKHAFLDRSRRSNAVHRRDLVKDITLCVELWPYPLARRHRSETDKELQENNKHLTWAISSFLRIMSTWKKGDISLRIEVYSPTDCHHWSWERFGDWTEKRTNGHLLRFVNVDRHFNNLRPVRCITQFGEYTGRGIHPASIGKIWKYMPNIRTIDSNLSQSDNRYKEEKAQERLDLGSSLAGTPFLHLTELTLAYPHGIILDHDFLPGPGEIIEVDQLCLAINKICQTAPLRKLQLMDGFVVSPDLFTRPESSVMWPKIETVEINMSGLTPKGGWYTTGSSTRFWRARFNSYGNPNRLRRLENGEVPKNPWRDSADPKEFDPLMVAVAEALLCMKDLRSFKLGGDWFELDFGGNCPDGQKNWLKFYDYGRGKWGFSVDLRSLWSLVVKEEDGGEIMHRHVSSYPDDDTN